MQQIEKAPRTKLSNGLVVANMSSAHPFTFVDGAVIPACSPERCKSGELKPIEIESEGIKGTTDIKIAFKLTSGVTDMLDVLEQDGEVDIVLVPFPVISALKAEGNTDYSKVRSIRVADRVSKEIHIDRFCI
jgi:hypothetical protein